MSVLVIGDANVDLELRLPANLGAAPHANPDPSLFPGGSAANTAAALGRLGVLTRFVGVVGDDIYGRFAAASLAEVGVDIRSIRTTPEAPTVMVILAVTGDGERLVYVWPPSGGAHTMLQVADATAAVTGATWLHVSGICLRMAPAREAILAAMALAQDRGIPVSFDLNLRLENWGWDDGFREVVDAAVARADYVLGSGRDEIAPLAGGSDVTEAATRLADGERVVIARLGADGAVACGATGTKRSPGFTVSVVDTVGAGDAFNAGFIAARIGGADLEDALLRANAVASYSVSRPGARATPTSEELEMLLRR